jgi:hypothetical protein
VIGRVDARRVIDGVGVQLYTVQRSLDAAELCEAEISAFADNLAAQLGAVGPDCIVGAIADLGV